MRTARSYYYVDQGAPGEWRVFLQTVAPGQEGEDGRGRTLVKVFASEAEAEAHADLMNGPGRTTEKLEAFRALVEEHQRQRYAKEYPNVKPPEVRVKPGKRWVKVDVGDSGKYMVDEDGSIVGIKAYGVPHYGHQYGTLDTIREWWWGDYVGRKVPLCECGHEYRQHLAAWPQLCAGLTLTLPCECSGFRVKR